MNIYEPAVHQLTEPLVLRAGDRLEGSHTPSWFPWSPKLTVLRGQPDWPAVIQIWDVGEGHPIGGSIQGLAIDCNGAYNGIWWRGSSEDWLVRDVEVYGAKDYGFRSDGVAGGYQQGVNLHNCHAWNNGVGFYWGNGSYDHTIRDCIAHHNGVGFWVDKRAASMQIMGCRAEWNGVLYNGPAVGDGHGFKFLNGQKIDATDLVTDSNGGDGVFVQKQGGSPLRVSCRNERDGMRGEGSGVRILGSDTVLLSAVQGFRAGDIADNNPRPAYGLRVGGSTVICDGYLSGVKQAYRNDGGGSTRWASTTVLNTNGAVSYKQPL